MTATAMLIALALDAAFGWPNALYKRIGHPVTWLGALIILLDTAWNNPQDTTSKRRARGRSASLLVIAAATFPALAVSLLLPGGFLGAALTGLLAAPLIAGRSLFEHVKAVADPLAAGDIDSAREAVSMIVGRNPQKLRPEGIARAAIESLAENTSDGVIAPLFWGLLFGLPGIAAYKAINTLDSMIGYRTDRHEDFGRFAAQLDDVANWVPARLTGAILALASSDPGRAFHIMRQDAPGHRSPNAGWPEAAMAAGLGCRLSGPRAYEGGVEDQPWLNAGAPDPGLDTAQRALGLYQKALIGATLTLLALAMMEVFL